MLENYKLGLDFCWVLFQIFASSFLTHYLRTRRFALLKKKFKKSQDSTVALQRTPCQILYVDNSTKALFWVFCSSFRFLFHRFIQHFKIWNESYKLSSVYCPQQVMKIKELKLKCRMFERHQLIRVNLLH